MGPQDLSIHDQQEKAQVFLPLHSKRIDRDHNRQPHRYLSMRGCQSRGQSGVERQGDSGHGG